jgi:hypothetical protein
LVVLQLEEERSKAQARMEAQKTQWLATMQDNDRRIAARKWVGGAGGCSVGLTILDSSPVVPAELNLNLFTEHS